MSPNTKDKIDKVSRLSVPILKRNGVTYAALFGSFVRKVSPGSNPNGQS